MFFSFWVLLGSSGFFWCSSVLSNTRRTPEEHQKNTRRTPEEHQKERQKNPQKEKNTSPPSQLSAVLIVVFLLLLSARAALFCILWMVGV